MHQFQSTPIPILVIERADPTTSTDPQRPVDERTPQKANTLPSIHCRYGGIFQQSNTCRMYCQREER